MEPKDCQVCEGYNLEASHPRPETTGYYILCGMCYYLIYQSVRPTPMKELIEYYKERRKLGGFNNDLVMMKAAYYDRGIR